MTRPIGRGYEDTYEGTSMVMMATSLMEYIPSIYVHMYIDRYIPQIHHPKTQDPKWDEVRSLTPTARGPESCDVYH